VVLDSRFLKTIVKLESPECITVNDPLCVRLKYPPDSLRVLGKYEEMEKGKDDTYWKRRDALGRLDYLRIQ
jgi:hypothetical protein